MVYEEAGKLKGGSIIFGGRALGGCFAVQLALGSQRARRARSSTANGRRVSMMDSRRISSLIGVVLRLLFGERGSSAAPTRATAILAEPSEPEFRLAKNVDDPQGLGAGEGLDDDN